eukprot:GFYU01001180.1.p1 GENE.GFYU01001180.1~~GFYU01001180.1.p1  ORF type:complete len:316 (+),score=51.63 GFYU01001180.1:214-1161(+)
MGNLLSCLYTNKHPTVVEEEVIDDPASHGVQFGSTFGPNLERAPVKMCRFNMEADVLAYLQADAIFNLREGDMEGAGFERHVDHKHKLEHIYYEGYFHTKPRVRAPIRSVHPRFGHSYDKPAGSDRMYCFIEALRRANAGVLEAMERRLPTHESGNNFRTLLQSGDAFADWSVQYHWGETIEVPDILWHNDAPNSLLHLALSVQGRRAIHGRLAPDNSSDTKTADVSHWLDPGHMYVSSPWAFTHGVEYPAHRPESPIIAVQCRFLTTPDDWMYLNEYGKQWYSVMKTITNVLATHELVSPTLEQITAIENELLP